MKDLIDRNENVWNRNIVWKTPWDLDYQLGKREKWKYGLCVVVLLGFLVLTVETLILKNINNYPMAFYRIGSSSSIIRCYNKKGNSS
ncbi:hypothetical protein ACJX0J_037708, partial [Zea mays]